MVTVNKNFVASVFRTFDLNLDTLPNRIAFQKTVFLLQKLGINSGYSFGWYSFGPYSSQLAKEGFSVEDNDVSTALILEHPSVEKFKELKKDFEKDSKFLELMADIVFLKSQLHIQDHQKIFQRIVQHRVYLNNYAKFKLALERLSKAGLI